MTTILQRLLTVCLALAFLVGTTVQVLPSSMAIGGMGVRADMAGGAGPQPPCTGHMPNCVDHVGCVTVSALPVSPGSEAVAFEWTSLVNMLPCWPHRTRLLVLDHEQLIGRELAPQTSPLRPASCRTPA